MASKINYTGFQLRADKFNDKILNILYIKFSKQNLGIHKHGSLLDTNEFKQQKKKDWAKLL